MTLPDLALQIIYGRLAWAVVFAALAAGLLPAALRRSPRAVGALTAGMALLMLLPQQLSPAFWIALAFQWPSGLLLACCLLKLLQPWRAAPGPLMPTHFAAAIAAIGTVLYVDAMGLLPLGLYYAGFGPKGAPLLALAAAVLCVAAILRGRARTQDLAVLLAVTLYCVLRLPTGNLWDALLDPMLFLWAVATLGAKGWRRLARKPRRSPTLHADVESEPAIARQALAE